MRLRSTTSICLFFAAVCLGGLWQVPDERVARAQQFDVVEPGAHGAHPDGPADEMSEAESLSIVAQVRADIEELERQGLIEPARPDAVPLQWPVRMSAAAPWFAIDGISNYVDHNPAFPNQIRDWNCGTRTYDQSSGYNHAGIDIFLWPFSWNSMDAQSAEIVAAAPGTIVTKIDGNPDRSCSLNGTQWNAVYVRHSDNSIAWYGHMKTGSLTTKPVGATVEAGERLGTVGSSGNSTGPHLHFELRNAQNQLQDPFHGACNTMNTNSWWTDQQPYRIPRLNALTTGGAFPAMAACVNEVTNLKSTFAPGENIFVTAFYRDITIGPGAQLSLVRPDGTVQQNWTHNATQNYNAAWFAWQWNLPTNVPTGTWKVRAAFGGNTFETPFVVAVPTATLGGRVTTPTGLGLRNATVSLIEANNVRRTATTSSFGVYSFDNVTTGASYTVAVASKRYRFTPRSAEINASVSNFDFVGLE